MSGSKHIDWTFLPDGCVTSVLERLDVWSLLNFRLVSQRARLLATQPALWRGLLADDYPVQYARLHPQPPPNEWPTAYRRRHTIQRRWDKGAVQSQELKAHTGPVFSVMRLEDPYVPENHTISGGVFGYGEVSELFQWNKWREPVPLDWADSAQLGGVIALTQRPGGREVVVGGFAGCAQVLTLEELDVSALADQEHHLLVGTLPNDWLSQSVEELVERVRQFGTLYQARHTHTLYGHAGAVPGAAAMRDIVATSGFDGNTHIWRPQAAQQGDEGVRKEAPVATLVDAETETPVAPGGVPESQSVCAVVLSPDCTTLASGCNDHLVRLWDVERKAVTRRLRGHTGWVWCLEAGPSPSTLVSAATDGSLRMWDLRTGGQVACLPVGTRTSADPTHGAIGGISLRPDKQVVACGSFDTLVSTVDLRTWTIMHSLKGHNHRITRVAATDDGIFSASFDSTLRHWSFADDGERVDTS